MYTPHTLKRRLHPVHVPDLCTYIVFFIVNILRLSPPKKNELRLDMCSGLTEYLLHFTTSILSLASGKERILTQYILKVRLCIIRNSLFRHLLISIDNICCLFRCVMTSFGIFEIHSRRRRVPAFLTLERKFLSVKTSSLLHQFGVFVKDRTRTKYLDIC